MMSHQIAMMPIPIGDGSGKASRIKKAVIITKKGFMALSCEYCEESPEEEEACDIF